MKKILLLFAVVCISINAHSQWVVQGSGFTTISRGIANFSVVNANTVWALAYDGSNVNNPCTDFTKTTDGGTTWTPGTVTPAAGLGPSAIFAIDANTAWSAFFNPTNGGGGIYKTTDGGANWTQQTSAAFAAPAGFPNLIHFWDANTGVCMGDPNGNSFEIYTTTDGGTNWVRVDSSKMPTFISGEYGYNFQSYSVVGNTIWFITNKGRVYKSTDKGANWTVATSGFSNINKIAFKDASNGVCTFSGALRASTDGGATWAVVTKTGKMYPTNITYVPGTPGTYVSTGAGSGAANFGSSYSKDNGVTWVTIDTAVQHTAVNFISGNTGWSGGFASSAANGIYKWTGGFIGLDEKREGKNLEIFPNPSVNGYVTLSAGNITGNFVRIVIYDALGKQVLFSEEKLSASYLNKNINISFLHKGIYIVELSDGTNAQRKKLIIE
jgi:photosystem II stability/assembly factor-like uncharacterized protein